MSLVLAHALFCAMLILINMLVNANDLLSEDDEDLIAATWLQLNKDALYQFAAQVRH